MDKRKYISSHLQHPDFPSDLLTLLSAVEATFEVVWKEEGREQTSNHLPSDWLTTSMDRKLLKRILLPSLPSTTKLFTHKVLQLVRLTLIPSPGSPEVFWCTCLCVLCSTLPS